MHLADLLEHHVVDADGRDLGSVHDVRCATDDLRVTALVAGPGAVAYRLGYATGRVQGPWLLAAIAERLRSDVWIVPWEDVDRLEDGAIHLRVRREDLTPLTSDRRQEPS